MKNETPRLDRRIQRTRRLLGEALIGLIVERGYDGLTIKDVTDRADVAYVTFFRHYRSLNELLSELLNETIQRMTVEIETAMPGGAAWYTPEGGLRIFTHVGEHAALYRILLTSPVASDCSARNSTTQHGVVLPDRLTAGCNTLDIAMLVRIQLW